MYFFLLYLILSLNNVFIVWLVIELIFIFFLLFSLNYDSKSVGLVLYFFFQRLMSLFLFIRIFYCFDKVIFLLLSAKLGLFPFFYWIVVVTVKVGLFTNIFILSFQKISVFWILWLTLNVSLNLILLLVYLSLFFVIFNLLIISDLWLILVYSSIVNTGLILLRVFGIYYLFVVFMYLIIIFLIIFLIKFLNSYIEIIIIVFFFLVIPPFILFFIKFYIVLSFDMYIKLIFLLIIFDVFVLLYYFSIIFIKFILIDLGILIYFINLIILIILIIFRNCVTMIVFY
jgi:hypothetical protein